MPGSSASPLAVPTWPRITATVRADGTGEVALPGRPDRRVEEPDLATARTTALAHVQDVAEELSRPVRVTTVDPEGSWQLIVHPGGRVEEVGLEPQPGPPAQPAPSVQDRTEAPTLRLAPPAASGVPGLTPGTPVPPGPQLGDPVSQGQAHLAAAHADPLPDTLPTHRDWQATQPRRRPEHAEQGWQGALRRATGGLVKPSPSGGELAWRRHVQTVQRSYDGPRTVVVANPKGGAPKTTSVLALAATLGQHRGGGVLAWDVNENRGTLGLRAMTNPEQTNTAVELLRDLDRFTGPAARLGDLDNYVRPQGDQHFDVLASTEDPARRDAIGAEEYRQLHRLLSRFYRLVIVDTGNSSIAPCWEAAVASADQLVVPMSLGEDTVDHAAFMLEQLLAQGHTELVRNATTVLVRAETTAGGGPGRARAQRDLARRVHAHFGTLTRTVVEVPPDPALAGGRPIDYQALTPRTRAAWLQVAAEVSRGL